MVHAESTYKERSFISTIKIASRCKKTRSPIHAKSMLKVRILALKSRMKAIILILIINYNFKKKGLIIKRALSICETSQLLQNLVLFKLYLPAFAPFSI